MPSLVPHCPSMMGARGRGVQRLLLAVEAAGQRTHLEPLGAADGAVQGALVPRGAVVARPRGGPRGNLFRKNFAGKFGGLRQKKRKAIAFQQFCPKICHLPPGNAFCPLEILYRGVEGLRPGSCGGGQFGVLAPKVRGAGGGGSARPTCPPPLPWSPTFVKIYGSHPGEKRENMWERFS